MTQENPIRIRINTLTPLYDKVEDRIRLCINYQNIQTRIDLMMTRDFILKLLPTYEEYLYTHYPNLGDDLSSEIVVEPSKEDSFNDEKPQNSFKKTNMEDLKIYQNKEELLVTVNFSFDKKSKFTVLTFISKQNTQCIMQANDSLLKDILSSIKGSVPKLSWGIGYI